MFLTFFFVQLFRIRINFFIIPIFIIHIILFITNFGFSTSTPASFMISAKRPFLSQVVSIITSWTRISSFLASTFTSAHSSNFRNKLLTKWLLVFRELIEGKLPFISYTWDIFVFFNLNFFWCFFIVFLVSYFFFFIFFLFIITSRSDFIFIIIRFFLLLFLSLNLIFIRFSFIILRRITSGGSKFSLFIVLSFKDIKNISTLCLYHRY